MNSALLFQYSRLFWSHVFISESLQALRLCHYQHICVCACLVLNSVRATLSCWKRFMLHTRFYIRPSSREDFRVRSHSSLCLWFLTAWVKGLCIYGSFCFFSSPHVRRVALPQSNAIWQWFLLYDFLELHSSLNHHHLLKLFSARKKFNQSIRLSPVNGDFSLFLFQSISVHDTVSTRWSPACTRRVFLYFKLESNQCKVENFPVGHLLFCPYVNY